MTTPQFDSRAVSVAAVPASGDEELESDIVLPSFPAPPVGHVRAFFHLSDEHDDRVAVLDLDPIRIRTLYGLTLAQDLSEVLIPPVALAYLDAGAWRGAAPSGGYISPDDAEAIRDAGEDADDVVEAWEGFDIALAALHVGQNGMMHLEVRNHRDGEYWSKGHSVDDVCPGGPIRPGHEQPDLRDAADAALHWLEAEREAPGQTEPVEILRVLREALAVGETPVSLALDLWDFIDNCADDDPDRQDRFFALRARICTLPQP